MFMLAFLKYWRIWLSLGLFAIACGVSVWIVLLIAKAEKVDVAEAATRQVTADFIAYQTQVEIVAQEDAKRLAHNSKVISEHNAQLVSIAADRAGLVKRLRDTESDLRRQAAAQATGERGVDVSREIARRAAEIDAALADYDAACRADAATLTALQDQVRPQISIETLEASVNSKVVQ